MTKNFFDFKIKSFDVKQGIIIGHASTFGNVDRVGDIVVKGAFKKTIQENQTKPVFFNHQYDHMVPIGITKTLKEDNVGLYTEIQLNMESTLVKDLIWALNNGAIKSFSIGYEIIKNDYNEKGQQLLKEIKLLEISIVTFPANEKAEILEVKNDEEHSEKVSAEPIEDKQEENMEVKADFESEFQFLEVYGGLERRMDVLYSVMQESMRNLISENIESKEIKSQMHKNVDNFAASIKIWIDSLFKKSKKDIEKCLNFKKLQEEKSLQEEEPSIDTPQNEAEIEVKSNSVVDLSELDELIKLMKGGK